MEEQMVKKSIESLTEEIIQLKAERIVASAAMETLSETNKKLRGEITKLVGKNSIKGVIICALAGKLIYDAVKKRKAMQFEKHMEDFDGFDDDVFEK